MLLTLVGLGLNVAVLAYWSWLIAVGLLLSWLIVMAVLVKLVKVG
jgi:hypothetical protein